jgi:hypothetical protein
MSRRSSIWSRERRRKPSLFLMLLEKRVAARVERTRHPAPSASTTTAVATSPKMKWQSRSRHSRCPEVISGETISARRTLPARIMSDTAASAKVAEEQATFMSKAKPPAPRRSWISTAIAG